MEAVNLTVFSRPARLAFIIENEEQALKAMQYCTVLWGGIYNEIYNKTELYNRNWKSEFDYYVVFDDIIGIEKDKVVTFDQLIRKETKNAKGTLFVDVISVYQHLSAKTYEAVNPKKNPSLIETFRFGSFPEFVNRKYFESYSTLLKSKDTENHPNPDLPAQGRRDDYYPIEFTSYDLRFGNRRHRSGGSIFFGGNHNDFNDIICAWNLRARGNSITWVDLDNVEKSYEVGLEWWKSKLDEESKVKVGNFPSALQLAMRDPEVNKKAIEPICGKGKISHCRKMSFYYEEIERPFSIYPRTEDMHVIGFWDGRQLTYQHPVPDFLDRDSHNLQKLGLCFENPTIYGVEQNTYMHSFPQFEGVEKCLLSSAQREGIRVTDKIITQFDPHLKFNQSFWLNSPFGVLENVFLEKKYKT